MITNPENKSVQKCIEELKKIGVNFELDQDETDVYNVDGEVIRRRKLENVVFTKENIKIKIAFEIFFRHSGLSTVMESRAGKKKNEQNFVTLHHITDEEFYLMQYQQIEYVLNLKKNGKR